MSAHVCLFIEDEVRGTSIVEPTADGVSLRFKEIEFSPCSSANIYLSAERARRIAKKILELTAQAKVAEVEQ